MINLPFEVQLATWKDGRFVACAFGPAGAWLTDVGTNQWAFDELKKMREKTDQQ